MLVWFRDGVNTGLYTAEQESGVREMIYQQLRMDAVDAFFYFYCRPEVAMEREYGKSATKATGSKMNFEFLNRIVPVYESVLADLEREIPGLPLVRLDTSDFENEEETTNAFLFHLLPILQKRFNVLPSSVLPHSPGLMRRAAFAHTSFEEQLKLTGHPSPDRITSLGWELQDKVEQTDTYFNIEPDAEMVDSRFAAVVRVREEGDRLLWVYKGEAEDHTFSHRRAKQVPITTADVADIRKKYPKILAIKKSRVRYRLEREPSKSKGHFFTLHIDHMDIGDFTEIRARGSDDGTHEDELLQLATELGFKPSDIIRGSYLALALEQKRA